MVRSCLTWDHKAQEFTTRMSGHFWNGWMDPERIAYRGQHFDETYESMARFVWDTEDLMNQAAAELWPRTGGARCPLPAGR